MIVAVPAATAVTSPEEFTVAIAALLVVQVMFLLVALDGATVAVSCCTPVLPIVADVLDKVTPVTAIGAVLTVMALDAVLPPSCVVTVMVQVPAATPVTTPVVLTVAIAELLVDQVTFLFVALDGVMVAVSCVVAPTFTDAEVGDTDTPVTATLPDPVVTVTLSKVAVFSKVLLCAVTARPTCTADAMVIVVAAPTCVQVVPLVETKLVNTLPTLTSLTQYGAVPAGPAVWLLAAPVLNLFWKASPFPEVTAVKAWAEFAAVVSRTITPAFAHGSVLPSVTTRAVIVTSPVTG